MRLVSGGNLLESFKLGRSKSLLKQPGLEIPKNSVIIQKTQK